MRAFFFAFQNESNKYPGHSPVIRTRADQLELRNRLGDAVGIHRPKTGRVIQVPEDTIGCILWFSQVWIKSGVSGKDVQAQFVLVFFV